MDLFPKILLVSFIGGIVATDTAAAWQIMISQPVVACPLLGWLLGDVYLGLTIGILLELPWLINIPMGGVHGAEGNLGAVVATSLSIYLKAAGVNTENIVIIVSILYSLLISRIGMVLVDYVRLANNRLLHRADVAARQGDLSRISLLNLIGVFYSFLMGALLVGVGYWMGVLAVKPVAAFIHQQFDSAFGLAKWGLLGLGVGAVATLFISKATQWYVLIPFFLGMVARFVTSMI